MPELLDEVRASLRVRHYSYRTEKTYVHWIKRYIVFHGVRHPKEMGPRKSPPSSHTWPPPGVCRLPRRTKHSAPCSSSRRMCST